MSAARDDWSCPGCLMHDMADDCWHSEASWPVAVALATAFHDEADVEKAWWFADDAEEAWSDIHRHVSPPYSARILERAEADITPILVNGRLLLTFEGTDDGSGESIVRAVALLEGAS